MNDQIEFAPAPVTATVTARKRNPLDVVLIGAAIVALAGVAFATGRLTAPTTPSAANAGLTAGDAAGRGAGRPGPGASFVPGQGGPGGVGAGGGLAGGGLAGGVTVSGSIVSVSATQITVQLANGTTVNIPIDTSTTYHTQASASSSDVKTGAKVEIQVSGAARAPGASGGPAAAASGGTTRQLSLGTASSITIIP